MKEWHGKSEPTLEMKGLHLATLSLYNQIKSSSATWRESANSSKENRERNIVGLRKSYYIHSSL